MKSQDFKDIKRKETTLKEIKKLINCRSEIVETDG